jgi:hypothetical protein
MLEAEALAAAVKLHRGKPEVEENAVDGEKVVFNADGLQIGEVIIDQQGGLFILGKPLPGGFKGVGVGIDTEELASGRAMVQNSRSMPPTAECTINVAATRLDG